MALDSRDALVLDRLVDSVRQSIVERGMIPLTEPQRLGIPHILEGENVLIISPTGMGKTEVALVPMLNEIVKRGLKDVEGIKILYITPLRALNRDLLDRIGWWSTRHDLNVSVRHGDSSKGERRSQALRPPDILITTPETFQIILVGRRLRKHVSKVKWIVVDELHEIAADKRGSQLSLGLERLKMILGGSPQLIGLSATVGSPEQLASFLSGSGKECRIVPAMHPREIQIQLTYPLPTPEDSSLAETLFVHPEVAARLRRIADQIRSHGSVLVFTNTRATAESLSNKLFMLGVETPISIHHGSLGVTTRVRAESGLKSGALKAVVTTSSLELGIDVGLIDFVVQYGSPRQATHLIQRVGRSGHRIGMTPRGEIITLDPDDALEALVVRNRALRGDIEPVDPPSKPLDVLAHQVVGLLFWNPRIPLESMLSVFRGSSPYRGIVRSELERVLDFLQAKYPALINYFREQDIVARGRSAKEIFEFYFGHVSTIPEVKHYPVIPEKTHDVVGELDEEFVAEKGLVGTKFVMAGRVWSIVRVSEGSVFVAEATDPLGAIPYWVGEEIPVPYEVAKEVGEIRAEVAKTLDQGKDLDSIAEELSARYGLDVGFVKSAASAVAENHLMGYPTATDRRVVIERCAGLTIIHSCLGDCANRSLSKLLGSFFSSETGTTITTNRDPYRVIINYDVPSERVLEVMRRLSSQEVDVLLSTGLESFGLFKRRLLHVARRFGVVPRDVDLTALELDKLTEELKETVVFEEARKELFHTDYDITTLTAFLRGVKEKAYELELLEGRPPSPLAQLAIGNLDRRYDIFPPEKADKILLKYAQVRLENTQLNLVCLGCKTSLGTNKASEVTAQLRCENCNSHEVGVLRSEDEVKALRYKPGSIKGKRALDSLRWTSRLLQEFGAPAAVVLAARGLTQTEEEGILREAPFKGERMIRLIVEAERKKVARLDTKRSRT